MKEHRFKPGWFLFAGKKPRAQFYKNEKYPNVVLVKTPGAGVLYPYYFMIGKSEGQDFLGRHRNTYAGINATLNTDFFADQLQKIYYERKVA